jgi:antibiotic biosynthesis monooxygenase (ABM) superfamily enzyme
VLTMTVLSTPLMTYLVLGRVTRLLQPWLADPDDREGSPGS